MKDFVVQTRQDSKAYGSFYALKQVSMHVKQGDIYGLIGDNGAGKSTLLKLLTGLARATEGEIRLWGKYEEKELKRCRKQIGAMVEQPGLLPGLSAEQNLEYYRIQKGIPGKTCGEEVLKLVGLWERRKDKCGKLSPGMKQRLGLAMAMLGEPRFLILDEPVNGLDPSGIREFRSLMHRLNEEKNVTILLSSHILAELQQTATVFGFLSKGRLLEEITAAQLEERCADCIIIRVVEADTERYAAQLERFFPEARYRVLADKSIRITGKDMEEEVVSRLAYENGILITALERRRYTLEDYYMNLKNGGAGAC